MRTAPPARPRMPVAVALCVVARGSAGATGESAVLETVSRAGLVDVGATLRAWPGGLALAVLAAVPPASTRSGGGRTDLLPTGAVWAGVLGLLFNAVFMLLELLAGHTGARRLAT